MKFLLAIVLIFLVSCSRSSTPAWQEEMAMEEGVETSSPPPPSAALEGEALEREAARELQPAPEENSFLYDDSRYEPFTTTGDVLDQLEAAVMVFNMPEIADIEQTLLAQLKVDYHLSAVELSRTLISNEGHMITENISVSKVLSAELVAPTLKVDPLTPPSQALSSREPTEWVWTLTPISAGEHLVVLTVNAIVNIEGEREERNIKIYRKNMKITVTTKYAVNTWIKENWEWLLSGLLFPLTVWFWNRKKKTSEQ